MDFKMLIEKCESDLRAGRIGRAAHALRGLRGKEIPRPLILTFANLCRRSQLDNQSLRLLAPFVRGKGPTTRPDPAEAAEYAAALQKVGAVREAMALLKPIDPGQVPLAPLFLAFCHFREWEYALAIPLLEDYIARAPSPYLKLVGEMNLAAALVVSGQTIEALQATSGLIEITGRLGYSRLLANAHELRAQIHINREEWWDARLNLNLGHAALGSENSPDGFFLRKWTAILNALENGECAELDNFRTEAYGRQDWESCREADFYSLKIRFDEQLFQHLMFGTPFEGYRQRVLTGLQATWSEREFTLGPTDGAKFLVKSGQFIHSKASPPSKLIHQLVAALLHDLYRPRSIAELFAAVFPGQHFDVFSSPNRIHQLLARLRQWIGENQLPLAVSEMNGHYRLEQTGSLALVLSRDLPVAEGHLIQLDLLMNHFGHQPFTSQQAQARLGISPSGFKRFARWAMSQQKLRRSGQSRAIVYRFQPDESRQCAA